jgi:hypothetical protein
MKPNFPPQYANGHPTGKGRQRSIRGMRIITRNGDIMETMGTKTIRMMRMMTNTMTINMTNKALDKIPEKIKV